MKLRNSLILMVIIPVSGLFYFSIDGILDKLKISKEMNLIYDLTDISIKISAIIHATQKERGAAAGFIGSKGTKFKQTLVGQINDTDKKIEEFKSYLNSSSSEIGNESKNVINALNNLKQKRNDVLTLQVSGEEAIEYYTTINRTLLDLVNHISHFKTTSEISRNSISYINFLQAKERVGLERGLLNNVFSGKKFEKGMYNRFISLLAEQKIYFTVFLSLASKKQKDFFQNKLAHEQEKEIRRIREYAIKKDTAAADPLYWYNIMTKKINRLKDVENRLAGDLKEKSIYLKKQADAGLRFYIAITVIASAAALALIFFTSRQILNQLGGEPAAIAGIAKSIASEDFSEDFTIGKNSKLSVLSVMNDLAALVKERTATLREMASFALLTPAPVLKIDYNGYITTANEAAGDSFNIDDLIGKSWYSLTPEIDQNEFEQLQQGKTTTIQHELARDEKNFIFMYYNDIESSSIYAYGTNITRLKELEAQLRQSQKTEALGQLAGGIAHDFNALLAIIIGYGEIIIDDAPEDSLLRDNIEEILDAGNRAKELVKQIMEYSRPGKEQRENIHLVSLIEESVKLVRAAFPAPIKITTEFDVETDTVFANMSQVKQVIMNLCINARDAIGDNYGNVDITVNEVEIDKEMSRLHEVTWGTFFRVAIRDTGSGMKQDVLQRILEPFFTTKEIGKGSGMGLSIAGSVIKSHGGFLTIESEFGAGSTFYVYLPEV
ncbi:MAG: hypothetical protein GY754_33520 [bacterium]|nr:hypothetical protein [bacterium]